MHLVKRATHIGGTRLLLTFEDGEERIADIGPYLDGEVFAPLNDPSYFLRFRVNPDIDTVVWDNGADFSPDFLYDISRPLDSSTQLTAADRGGT